MRRFHTLVPALALIAAACSGSSSGPTTSSSTTPLTITTTSKIPPTTSVITPSSAATSIEIWVPGTLAAQVRETAAAFEIETGIGVDVTAVEIDAVLGVLLDDPASGPDVFIGLHTWLTTLTDAGIAEPLPSRSEVVAGALDAVTMRGTVFAAPLALDTIVQFRDTGALAAAPDTVESLAAGCADGEDVTPCLLLPTDSVEGHLPFILGAGGYIFGPDEFDKWTAQDVGIDTAGAIAGALILENIINGAGILGNGDSTTVERFIAGDAPLLWGDASSLAALSLAGISFAVEQLPTIAGVPAPAHIRATVAWVNAFSPGKDAAETFVIDYLATPVSANQIAITLGLAPVNIGFDAEPNLVPFIESARTGYPVPTIFQTDFAWDELSTAFDDIRSGDDVTEVLGRAATAIRNAPGFAPPVPSEEEDS